MIIFLTLDAMMDVANTKSQDQKLVADTDLVRNGVKVVKFSFNGMVFGVLAVVAVLDTNLKIENSKKCC